MWKGEVFRVGCMVGGYALSACHYSSHPSGNIPLAPCTATSTCCCAKPRGGDRSPCPGTPRTAAFAPVPAESVSPKESWAWAQQRAGPTIKAGAGQDRGMGGVGVGGDSERSLRTQAAARESAGEGLLGSASLPAPNSTSSPPGGLVDQVTPGAPVCPTVGSGQKWNGH